MVRLHESGSASSTLRRWSSGSCTLPPVESWTTRSLDSRTAATHSLSSARSSVGRCSASRTWRWIIAAPAASQASRGLRDLLGRGGQLRAVRLGRLGAGRCHGDQQRVAHGRHRVRGLRSARPAMSRAMRAVVQRVSSRVRVVDGAVVGALASPGLLVYLGVTHTDGPAEVDWMARKIWGAADPAPTSSPPPTSARRSWWSPSSRCTATPARAGARPGRPPRPGRSPSRCTTPSAPPSTALGAHVETRCLRRRHAVASVNDGPFTLLLDR